MKTTISLFLLCGFCLQTRAQVNFTLSSSPGVGPSPQYIIAVDVNGDGKMDLVTANQDNDTMTVLTNNGLGGFVLASSPSTGHDPVSIVATNVNGGGKMDLIAANYSTGLSVSTNDGAGNFTLSTSMEAGTELLSGAAADVNGDGKVDLISANTSPSSVSVFTNNGTGGFALSGVYTVGYNPWCVIAADVNGDGKPDLITANYGDNTLSVLTNDGTGNFVMASTNAVGTTPRSVTAADVNGDGKLDLICANSGDNTVTVLTNNGSGVFTNAEIYKVGGFPVFVTAADVNGDGSLDLITANNGDGTLTVLTNNGSGMFALAATITVGPTPRAVAVADVNGDGKLDLISANEGNSTVSVLTNATSFPPSSRPLITTQPASQTNLVGTTATLSVGAKSVMGVQQFSYQWQFDGTNLPAATNNVLILPNLTLSQAGNYAVVVINSAGSVTSNPALLTVLPVFVEVNGQLAVGTDNVPLSATVTIAGFPGGFNFYTLDGSTPTASSALYEGPIVLTNSAVIQAMSLSADFSRQGYSAPVTVQITTPLNLSTAGGGTFTVNGLPTSPASNYLTGAAVSLAASPSSGWSFLGWQGSISSTNNPVNFTMSESARIQAVFGTIVTTNVFGSGNVVLSQPNPVPYGSMLMASAVAEPGSYFVLWGGSASGTNAPISITVTSAIPAVSALFATLPASKYSLSVVVAGSGSVSNSLRQSYYNPGDNVVLTATANQGAYFLGWAGDATGANNPLLVQMTTNKVIVANFGNFPMVSVTPTNLAILAGSNGVLTATATGSPVLSYQWQNTNGAIANATNVVLVFSNAQPANAGSYSVVVSNSFGSVTSSVATVTVIGAPVITNQPGPVAVLVGHAATFAVGAYGWPLPALQWRLNGMNLSGAINATLTISNVFPVNGGTYTVAITNVYGSVTSSPAELTVLPLNITVPAKLVQGQFQITFDTAAGVDYEVEYSTNLMDWQPWLSLTGNGQPATLSDPNTSGNFRRFYRLMLSPR